MKLIIPMAGRGAHIRPQSHTTPKSLLPVAGTMIVERIIDTFQGVIIEIVFIPSPDFGQGVKTRLAEVCRSHRVKTTLSGARNI